MHVRRLIAAAILACLTAAPSSLAAAPALAFSHACLNAAYVSATSGSLAARNAAQEYLDRYC